MHRMQVHRTTFQSNQKHACMPPAVHIDAHLAQPASLPSAANQIVPSASTPLDAPIMTVKPARFGFAGRLSTAATKRCTSGSCALTPPEAAGSPKLTVRWRPSRSAVRIAPMRCCAEACQLRMGLVGGCGNGQVVVGTRRACCPPLKS